MPIQANILILYIYTALGRIILLPQGKIVNYHAIEMAGFVVTTPKGRYPNGVSNTTMAE
jgi:hypothetical protein